ncbi:MAG: NifU family protein [Calditrichaeota bacterium]|nr:NifU family protein [Calditrichota bacterium]
MEVDRRSVEIALDQLRPSFYMEGGDIRLLEIHPGGVVEVALSGACHGCGMSLMHIKMGVEQYLRQMVPGVTEVITPDFN